jgi:HEPN domain-containing protein/predicted nucleotidyltransferase
MIIKERLDRIVQEILAAAQDKIAMIILFGSYARGTWVQDEYFERHVRYSYQSDLDIMIVLKKGKYLDRYTLKVEDKIMKRLESASLVDAMSKEPWITLILESIKTVNSQLEKGHYFYSDIKKEGILLYDSKEFQLAEAKILPWSEKRPIAIKDYRYWFHRGAEFLIDTHNTFNRGNFTLGAFYLHQATESFYNAILLVFSGYKPKLHDIKKLGSVAGNYDEELWEIFPYSSAEQVECFRLLEQGYVGARYDDTYTISKEQLAYLIERVEKLKIVTEKICVDWLKLN